ncbi:hypothetical protein [Nonomuraea sp. SYSU D8015]|uniref:hypothetical protein n=1 Tax=Nonomuraea sp. SYSU D8015 TaxID=2593644 RepID=UPI001660B1AE|nr:hypothetical protein [Nonomuraea sp. SYSU D8015]
MALTAELADTQAKLDDAQALNHYLMTMVRNLEAELRRPLAPPPEVQRAMSVRTSRMHPITITAGGRKLVVVAPPEGFDDPVEVWRNVVDYYGSGGGN